MTNFKNALILTAVLVVLAGIYVFVERPFEAQRKKETPAFVPDFEKAKADAVRITITSPTKGKVTLTKKDQNTWTVSAQDKIFDADGSAVQNVLDTVAKLTAHTVASRNPQNFDSFEVSEAKGIEVKIEDGSRVLAHFYVGKNGPDIFSTYLRQKDANTVVLTNTLVKTVFERELKDWRDKTIVRVDKDAILEYVVEGDMSLAMKKDDTGVWQVVKPSVFTAKKDAAEKVITSFSGLKAVDFPEGKLSEFGLDKPRRTIRAVLKDGSSQTLFVGKEKNAYQFFVKTASSDTVYVIEKYSLESLCPALDTLREAEKKAAAQQPDNATKK
ncbi:MAG: DUF4340 domain-containing protein [Desulfobacterota bacterium]|nr:DUF4340 domain-containing protein [Thermodesulfobacteriota bacterium]